MSARQLSLLPSTFDDCAARIGRSAFAAIVDARKEDPTYRLTEEALVSALRPALKKELPKSMRVNGRNPLFDALAVACDISPEKLTRSSAGMVAKAVKEIREVEPSVSAEDLTRVAAAVRRKFPKAGPMAVSAHWTEFEWVLRKSNKDATPMPNGPVGWLATLNALFPESTIARGGMFEITQETPYNWSNLEPVVRNAILEGMK